MAGGGVLLFFNTEDPLLNNSANISVFLFVFNVALEGVDDDEDDDEGGGVTVFFPVLSCTVSGTFLPSARRISLFTGTGGILLG